MSEEERIKAVIRKYYGYLEGSDADIAQTVKGVWFFLLHDPEAESYYRFFCFRTADELERGIMEVVADELGCLLEVAVEGCSYKMEEADLDGVSAGSCRRALAKLAGQIRVLGEEWQKILPRMVEIAESLSGVSGQGENG